MEKVKDSFLQEIYEMIFGRVKQYSPKSAFNCVLHLWPVYKVDNLELSKKSRHILVSNILIFYFLRKLTRQYWIDELDICVYQVFYDACWLEAQNISDRCRVWLILNISTNLLSLFSSAWWWYLLFCWCGIHRLLNCNFV